MRKYFRTLFYLIRFFLEDDFLLIDYPKDDYYYPIISVVRQMLRKHIFEPFKSTHTIKVNANYALAFQSRLLTAMGCNQPISKENMDSALNKLLLDFQLALRIVYYDKGVISSFSYSYI